VGQKHFMSTGVIVSIITGGFGFLIVTLIGIVGFFISRSYDAADKANDSMGRIMDKHADSLGKLALSIQELSGIIKSLEAQFMASSSNTERVLREHYIEIELVRNRTHRLINYITALRLQGELKNGWKFASNWDFPGVTIEEKEEK
jgi:hypothetical protein